MIEFKNVSKSFDGGKSFSLREISLSVPKGKVLALLGTSGSGKSTLIRMVNKLIEPTTGEIFIGSRPISSVNSIELRRQIGYVVQDNSLFPHLSAKENVALPLKIHGIPKFEHQKRIDEMLKFVGLEPDQIGNRYPDELSGGQQQRVNVARALIHSPNFLLMDEPFGALDPITRNTLQSDFLELQNQLKITIILVTHDLPEALRLADYVAILSDGVLQQVGTTQEITSQPANDFVSNLLQEAKKQKNLLEKFL